MIEDEHVPTISFTCSLGIERLGHYKTTIEGQGTDSCTIAVDMDGRMFVGIKSIERWDNERRV